MASLGPQTLTCFHLFACGCTMRLFLKIGFRFLSVASDWTVRRFSRFSHSGQVLAPPVTTVVHCGFDICNSDRSESISSSMVKLVVWNPFSYLINTYNSHLVQFHLVTSVFQFLCIFRQPCIRVHRTNIEILATFSPN